MCIYCARVGKAAGGFGCADVPAMTVDAKSDATAVDLQDGATLAPTVATDDPVSQKSRPRRRYSSWGAVHNLLRDE
jgi:hypothetical protein